MNAQSKKLRHLINNIGYVITGYKNNSRTHGTIVHTITYKPFESVIVGHDDDGNWIYDNKPVFQVHTSEYIGNGQYKISTYNCTSESEVKESIGYDGLTLRNFR